MIRFGLLIVVACNTREPSKPMPVPEEIRACADLPACRDAYIATGRPEVVREIARLTKTTPDATEPAPADEARALAGLLADPANKPIIDLFGKAATSRDMLARARAIHPIMPVAADVIAKLESESTADRKAAIASVKPLCATDDDAHLPAAWCPPDDGFGTTGSGPMRGKTASVPTMSLGSATTTGDKTVIRRYIKRNRDKLQACYEARLVAKPSSNGTVDVTFQIGANGGVTRSTGKGFDREIDTCVAGVIAKIEFPATGAVVDVVFPFTFRLAGGM